MEDVSLEGVLRQYITNSINGMFTSMPGKIERVVDLGEQRVDIQLLVDRVTPDDGVLKHPAILNVPLVFPGSRSSQVSFPVQAGDTVLCIFSQRSIDRFKLGANDNHRPLDFRKHSRNDCIAIPGLFSFPSSANNPSRRSLSHDTSDTVVAHNLNTGEECEIRFKSSGEIIFNTPSAVTINSSSTTINSDTTINGALEVIGSGVTHNGVDIGESHIHTGDNGGLTSPPIGSAGGEVSTTMDGGTF